MIRTVWRTGGVTIYRRYIDLHVQGAALDHLIRLKTGHTSGAGNPSVQYLKNFSVIYALSINFSDLLLHEQADSAVVQEVNVHGRKCWRLGAMDEAGIVEHEISFRVHGILSKVDLVPGNIARLRVTNLCQRVELTGLGSESFLQSINKVLVVQDAFRRFFAGQRVSSWNFADEDGHSRFNCTCLYLTKTDGRAAEEVPFGPGVDPLGQLAKFRTSDLVHTAENDMKYFRLAKPEQDSAQPRETFYEAFPASFRKGDIVEVEGTVVAFFSKNGMVKTIFQMNVVTLLDATFSKVRLVFTAFS
ncbi:hypothetical protein R3P38DRAFT_2544007 [Favolaschia claudopus]|uniref:Uncharacterized protein n=1 Tax=Favolaschia claudopus TaxID=2862362 RepID=A0AAW0APW4_9AGAR